jgi:hypothetical protein
MNVQAIPANQFRIIDRGSNQFCRRGGLPIAIMVILFLWQSLLADGPATQPADDDTPQAFLAGMTDDRIAAMNVRQMMAFIDFDPDSDRDRAGARLLATSDVAVAKLEVAVRKKWGTDAETAVAHACWDNVLEDTATAQWTMTGDHAKATFQLERLGNVMLVKTEGHWKLDLSGYRSAAGDKFNSDLRAGTAEVRRLLQELANIDPDTSAAEFTRHVREEMDKLAGSN